MHNLTPEKINDLVDVLVRLDSRKGDPGNRVEGARRGGHFE
jgi:hypothetical protein